MICTGELELTTYVCNYLYSFRCVASLDGHASSVPAAIKGKTETMTTRMAETKELEMMERHVAMVRTNDEDEISVALVNQASIVRSPMHNWRIFQRFLAKNCICAAFLRSVAIELQQRAAEKLILFSSCCYGAFAAQLQKAKHMQSTSKQRVSLICNACNAQIGGDDNGGDGDVKDGDAAENGGDGANRRNRRFRPRNRPNKNRSEQVRITRDYVYLRKQTSALIKAKAEKIDLYLTERRRCSTK